MTEEKPTDYAALIQAAQTEVPTPPEWLAVGKYIYALNYGLGEVVALLGKRLIVQFLEDVSPIHFTDWKSAVENSEILPRSPASASSGNNREVVRDAARASFEQISKIPSLSLPIAKARGFQLPDTGVRDTLFQTLASLLQHSGS